MPKRGNGEGSIYRRKDGRWVGQYLVYTSKGPKYRYIYGRTRADVSKKLTKAIGIDEKVGLFCVARESLPILRRFQCPNRSGLRVKR